MSSLTHTWSSVSCAIFIYLNSVTVCSVRRVDFVFKAEYDVISQWSYSSVGRAGTAVALLCLGLHHRDTDSHAVQVSVNVYVWIHQFYPKSLSGIATKESPFILDHLIWIVCQMILSITVIFLNLKIFILLDVSPPLSQYWFSSSIIVGSSL